MNLSGFRNKPSVAYLKKCFAFDLVPEFILIMVNVQRHAAAGAFFLPPKTDSESPVSVPERMQSVPVVGKVACAFTLGAPKCTASAAKTDCSMSRRSTGGFGGSSPSVLQYAQSHSFE